ncbi:hypothetical protein N7495_001214 [Penicillium taxi]|uniref:uncharacterized protein n=1 Tax=Penicillium taxi TaxID=168475 RepID=UPI002545A42A|nr:uncharacterized protein N7495_001214 [Penicillium taxi]KAJ5908532.1 hypothetical protein N7495_001214 [Penicillium taxi]
MFVKLILAAMLGISIANAHMIMTNPVPYGKDSLNNSPLAADGSDFPCKLRSDTYEITKQNVMVIGESQTMTFEGSATHGGGSCQISLTSDLSPSKDTEWKVIQSYEGGCVANVEGNLSGGASMTDPDTFNYTIPDGFTPGKYTLAWTWFNRVGNREMYMNCAPVTVEAKGSSKREVQVKPVEKRSSNYPPMFIANVNGCTTPEGVDIRFPQPGSAVQYLGEAINLAKVGAAACTGTATFASSGDTTSSSSSDSLASDSDSDSDSGSSTATAAVISTATTASSQDTVATSVSIAASVETDTPAVFVPITATSTSQAVAASASASSTSSIGALSGSCSTEGEWNCISGSSFQRCASGQWSTAEALASGIECNNGKSVNLSISAAKLDRRISDMRFHKRIHRESHHL